MHHHDFQLGDIVQLTEQAGRKSKLPERQGIVVGFNKTKSQVKVRWAHLMDEQSIHWTSLQLAAPRLKSDRYSTE